MRQKQVTNIAYFMYFLCEIAKYFFLLYYNADIFNMRVSMFSVIRQSHKERPMLNLSHRKKHVIQDKQ